MAASRNKAPVGSAPWILAERHQAAQFVEQEVEEFSFSVRNEMEWLNEHVADIFSRPELNIADTFKTPGKLRGKTPRTIRKRNPLETRAPLTDIFAPNPANAPSPTRETSFYKQIEQIQIAEDPEDADMSPPRHSVEDADQTSNAIPPGDSGYHGMTEDEMDVDEDESVARLSPRKESPAKLIQSSPPKSQEPPRESASASFLSARENFEQQAPAHIEIHEDEDGSDADNEITIHEDEMDFVPTQPDESPVPQGNAPPRSPQFSVGDHTASALNSILNGAEDKQDQQNEQEQEQEDDDGARTPSDGSSPAKPLLRKSSLTFSSLPAREPLAGKKSMGSRVSRTSHGDQYKARSSHFGRFTGGKSLGGGQTIARADDDNDEVGGSESEDENAETREKTSTQRLHERINMLAKSQEPRMSKSIPGPASQEPNYPQIPAENDEPTAEAPKAPSPVPNIHDEDDDDWIAPVTSKPLSSAQALPAHLKSGSVDIMENVSGKTSIGGLGVEMEEGPQSEKPSPIRFGLGHLKSASVPNFESPAKSAAKAPESSHKKATSISDPEQLQGVEASTPAGSPSRTDDGPLSASKTKFFSVLKSAKSIFASSAGVSAQAKLEALSPSSARLRERHAREQVSTSPRLDLSTIFDKPINPASPARRPATSTGTPVRTTRASHERGRREREMEAEKEREEALQKAREEEDEEEEEEEEEEDEEQNAIKQERHQAKASKNVTAARLGAASRAETVSSRDDDYTSADDVSKPGPSRPQRGPPKMREPKSRLLKPTASKESLSKPRHIKVGLGSQRSHPTNADLSKSLHGTLPSVAKTPAAKNPADSANTSFAKTAGPSGAPVAKPTSLALAAKNKEREEREAQRKAEKKRAIEQQRAEKAAKAEEDRRKADDDRRAEAQRKAAEQQRAQEAKRAASRQALAAEAKKQEQLRAQAASKQTKDLAHALSKEKAATIHGHPRGDLGGARPISRVNTVLNIPPTNPAKPPKRFHADEESAPRPQAQRNAPTFQQLNAKRRKTLSDDEEEEPADARRSMMAPPIRQSNVRKLYPERERLMSVIDKAKEPNKFAHGYKPATAAGPSSHGQSMFKQTVKTQHQLQHNKHGGHPNDMATISKAKIPFADASGPSAAAGPSSVFKTPARTTTVPLASPHFPTPELPEIATDSEDEDSDSEAANFQAPSWVNSPALRELLTQQQLVDPMEVFGPIAPLQMEEIFKNKDRHKRFRERTSSAYWAKDKLTEEERKKDMEGREKLMRDGGWTYGNTGS